jgi:hypothetical protein
MHRVGNQYLAQERQLFLTARAEQQKNERVKKSQYQANKKKKKDEIDKTKVVYLRRGATIHHLYCSVPV